MLLSLAWKNIWRKKSRSFVLILAITLGLAGAVFSIALMNGMIKNRNEKIIERQLSHIQIHTNAFVENPKLQDTIKNLSEIISFLQKNENVKAICGRLKFPVILSSVHSSQGAMIFGINPNDEKKVTTLYKCLIDSNSNYINDKAKPEILISKAIAENLMMTYYLIDSSVITKIKDKKIQEKLSPLKNTRYRQKTRLKDSLKKRLASNEYEKYADKIINLSEKFRIGKKISIRFTDINGNFVDEAFKICGIFNTGDAMFDNTSVFVNKNYLAELAGVSPTATSEIAVLLKDKNLAQELKNVLIGHLDDLDVKTYVELDPLGVYQGRMIDIYYNIMIAFILFALLFAIINTVLMSVMERTKEIGMLMAIGMKKSRIFAMIMTESIMISLTGGILGMIIGGLVSFYFGKTGIDFSTYSDALEGFGIGTVIYPSMEVKFLINTTIMVIATGIIAAVYPALKALKLNPATALRSDV